MNEKLNANEICRLMLQLTGEPTWHGETNADNEAAEQIRILGEVAWQALWTLSKAQDSIRSAPEGNASAAKMGKVLDAVKDQLEEIL